MSSNKTANKKSALPLYIILGVLIASLVAAVILIGRNRTHSSTSTPQPQASNQQASGAVPVGTPHTKGPANAPIVIEEFGDYQCPSCGNLHPVMHGIESDYGDRLRVIFRQFPLQKIHPHASLAARAAVAAGNQNRFWEMHNKLYENQKEWSNLPDARAKFIEYAQQIGLNTERFQADLDSREVAARIFEDTKLAGRLRIQGTPSIILNGRLLTAEQTLDEGKLRAEIEKELAKGR